MKKMKKPNKTLNIMNMKNVSYVFKKDINQNTVQMQINNMIKMVEVMMVVSGVVQANI